MKIYYTTTNQTLKQIIHQIFICLLQDKATDTILKGFDKGLLSGMIVINLQKTFDTIDHEILLQKLKAIIFSIRLYSGLDHIFLS